MTDALDHDNVAHSMQPKDTPELRALYEGFEKEHLIPLWTQLGDLMPMHPKSKAVPHIWKWSNLLPLAEASGALVPVGRGGERRAIGLAKSGPCPKCLRQPDDVGGDPISWPTGNCTRTPPLTKRVPFCR